MLSRLGRAVKISSRFYLVFCFTKTRLRRRKKDHEKSFTNRKFRRGTQTRTKETKKRVHFQLDCSIRDYHYFTDFPKGNFRELAGRNRVCSDDQLHAIFLRVYISVVIHYENAVLNMVENHNRR